MRHMEKELDKIINEHMLFYEQKYNIRILFWSLRSSINIGIKRRNSDLDVMFSYISDRKNKCSGIHDITGHGLDFWGIEIHDILTTIKKNNEMAYQTEGPPKLWLIGPQHKRGGCNYYFGIYSTIGSSYYREYNGFLEKTTPLFLKMFEKKIAAQQLWEATRTTVTNIKYFGKIYLYDYLYAVWRLILCKHILCGNLPGENNILNLIEKYCSPEIKNDIQNYLELYKDTYTKESAYFTIPCLNEFILDNFSEVEKMIALRPYETIETYKYAYNQIIQTIHEISIRKGGND